MNKIPAVLVGGILLALPAAAQNAEPEYLTREANPPAGKAPGLKSSELEPRMRHFQLTFARGDEVGAGLAEFAGKNHLTVSRFTAIGAFDHAVIGWFDPEKRAYKVIRLNEEMEVTSFTGNILRGRDGKPVVHAHCTVALLRNGQIYSGHFVEGQISLTMQMALEDSEPLAGTR
jgi:predicted DNA-binding protein with PD1-like motif